MIVPFPSYFSYLCSQLSRHDPDRTQISGKDVTNNYLLSVPNLMMSKHLGESLQGNCHVTDLCLDFQNSPGSHVVLLKAIRDCKSIQSVKLCGDKRAAHLNHCFISSIAGRNKSLQQVKFYCMTLGANSLAVVLLGSGRAMHTFQIIGCRLLVRNPLEIQRAVTALHDHQYMKSLHLDIDIGMLVALQNGIISHPVLKELRVDGLLGPIELPEIYQLYDPPPDTPLPAILVICTILESPNSALCHLHLSGWNFQSDEVPFDTLLSSVLLCQTLTKLTFGGNCYFHPFVAQQLASIYQSTSSRLHSLGCFECSGLQANLYYLFKHHSMPGLKELDVTSFSAVGCWTIPLVLILGLDTSLEQCKLAWLDKAACKALIKVLPNIQGITKLDLGLEGEFDDLKEDIMAAFENNRSLVKVNIHYPGTRYSWHSQFTVKELIRIRLYTSRNSLLPLKACICESALTLLPQMFYVAEQCLRGPPIVLESLLQLKESIGPKVDQTISGKRKRPHFST